MAHQGADAAATRLRMPPSGPDHHEGNGCLDGESQRHRCYGHCQRIRATGAIETTTRLRIVFVRQVKLPRGAKRAELALWAALTVLTGACLVVYALDWRSPVRTIIAVAFVLLAPGLAAGENLPSRDLAWRLAIAPATGLAAATLIATGLLYAGLYTPGATLLLLALLTVALLGTAASRRRPTDRGKPRGPTAA
jgi:uncharacterized membrane protein